MTRLGGKAGLRQKRGLTLTPALRQSLGLLRMTSAELARFIDEAAARNPWIELSHSAPCPTVQARREGAALGGADPTAVQGGAALVAPAPSLAAYVMAYIDHQFPAGPARDTAVCFALALEPSGWLSDSVAQVAAASGVTEAEANAVLARLQQIDPPGLFARSLSDCLRLQAVEAGLADPAMLAVLDHLHLLAAGDLAAIALVTGIAEAEIAARAVVIRGFDPKPGARFAADVAAYGPPDLVMRPIGAGWAIVLNRTSLPMVRMRDGAPPDDPATLEVRRLQSMLGKRSATLAAIAREVTAHHGATLARPALGLRPLSRAQIAQRLGLHESTVGRAVAGAMVATPDGQVPLSTFFPDALSAEVSARSAQEALRRIIAGEDRACPVSDAALVALLAAEGIPLARRTVAKYRAALGLPPANRRKARP